MFLAPNGNVFMDGPTHATQYLNTSGTGSWSLVGFSNFDQRTYGTAVMYDDGKVMIMGGHLGKTGLPTNTAEVIDLQAGATWRYVAPMAEARNHASPTLLPDV